MIRVLEYRPSGGGYLKLTFFNTVGGIDSVLVSKTQADVRHHQTCSLSVLKLQPYPIGVCIQCIDKPLPGAASIIVGSSR